MRNSAGKTLIPMLFAAGLAQADGTVGDLARIQSDTILLRAKVDQAVVQSALNAANSTGIGSSKINLPVVKSVYGVGDQLYATFLYGSGVTVEAKASDRVPGGFKVALVSVEKVELIKGHKRFQVGFSATAPTQAQASSGAQIIGPPFMPALTSSPARQP